MSSDLLNLEANYAWSEMRYEKAPTAEKGKELAKKQVMIDQLRLGKKWQTRWFSSAELDQLGDDPDNWPAEPRKPLPTVKEAPKEDEEDSIEKLVEEVEWNGYTTLSLDSVIAMLEKMRERYGGKTAVMGVEFGGFSALSGVQEDSGCIVIE
jgi:hypothetical protein